MPKAKLSSGTKIEAILRKDFECTGTLNEELYCQVCFCMRSAFLLNSYNNKEGAKH